MGSHAGVIVGMEKKMDESRGEFYWPVFKERGKRRVGQDIFTH
jgi:hypothetical protein